MLIDPQARYLKTHEWAKKQTGTIFTAGLTAYAVEQLGDIVYMELPEVGKELTAGQPFGIVESVKSASDMYAPLTGRVVAANTEIPDNPDTLKQDAYDKGWLIKIEAAKPAEFDELMDADAYRRFLETEA
ncbi:MAG TPA: glycine cleavage system protein GcvH [Anaerohalosphaeraceae bacterium]|mgnify:CR=1 FL=1|nr:glycine cleavage system protein GcvH [Phycisphaerae bacterium]HOK97063.1 glycine cleavage system protein GcvH [Anaerohalosphaeraceae bacterium]HOL32623.1 glycine cleavage system protein GcvH [Anaerohalosphaeraceae bacterium]HOM77093.1 glycine cleavage system protein GcvH [Anaerohalosphaeraceae bacterium]HPC64945.1 glycine cleavage system protein GcvH [Anaerohalosphaeraceae bacterium]